LTAAVRGSGSNVKVTTGAQINSVEAYVIAVIFLFAETCCCVLADWISAPV
jgi:hypothetical protein